MEGADTLNDTDGVAIFSDRQNIPNTTDIDCDGCTDLLIGRLQGTVTRYEEAGTDANGVPRFRHVTDSFEDIEIVAQIGSLHGANTMALGDMDQDGDEDLLWGDYFEPGILYLENRGTCQTPSLRGTPLSFPTAKPLSTSGYNAPTIGDVDTDGDPDLLVGVLGGAYNPNTTTADNFHFIEQVAAGELVHRSSRFLSMLDLGSESIPIVVDMDGDGDLDILVGNKIEQGDTQNGRLYRFRNDGSPGSPSFTLDGNLDVGGGYHLLPALGDLDGDGDLDVILGTWSDQLRMLRNDAEDGSLSLSVVDTAVVTLARGRNATPTLGDIDGDGDLDLIVGSESEGLILFRNDGSSTSASFVDAGQLNVPHFGFAAPAFADMDGDGDDDLLLGGGRGGLWFYEKLRR